MEEIGRGAEAVVYITEFEGRKAVKKIRLPKAYRHPDLDRHLRNMRTKNEAKVMEEAKLAGVRTPEVYRVNLKESSITMEFIDGISVKNIIDGFPERSREMCEKIGEMVAKLHKANLSHGDLTTSNMILIDDEICLLDFSLGKRLAELEDLGVDFHLLERAFTSAHSTVDGAFDVIVESYREHMPDADDVLKRVEVIKKRARYT